MPSPLAGIRVLDLTNVLAGPFCCHQLAHLGAEVLKVETPAGGDLARQLGADAELNGRGMGVSFLAQNAGKRSITVDLKHPRGREVFHRLVAGAHAVNIDWITDDELAAQPDLVRTMSVKPPMGFGRVRLLRIDGVDLQPCGGTHVANTAEIGALRISKIEKKSARTRRVTIEFV